MIADIEQSAVERAAEEMGVKVLVVDVADPESVVTLASDVIRDYGRIDIVVNNAGVGPICRISDLTLADWGWVLDINLFGVINGIHTFLPLLRSNAEGGHIVNTASMSVFSPMATMGAYAAAKAGVAAISEVLAMELAQEESTVKVTLLTPGNVRTGISRSLRNRPTAAGGGLQEVDLTAEPGHTARPVWRTPREVGHVVAHAVEQDDFYAITHPEQLPRVEAHHDRVRAAFAGSGGAYDVG